MPKNPLEEKFEEILYFGNGIYSEYKIRTLTMQLLEACFASSRQDKEYIDFFLNNLWQAFLGEKFEPQEKFIGLDYRGIHGSCSTLENLLDDALHCLDKWQQGDEQFDHEKYLLERLNKISNILANYQPVQLSSENNLFEPKTVGYDIQ